MKHAPWQDSSPTLGPSKLETQGNCRPDHARIWLSASVLSSPLVSFHRFFSQMQRAKHRGLMLALFLFAAMTVLPLNGQQQNNGSFKGTVKDPQGAAIQDAKVIAVERSTGMSSTTKTSGTGDYVLLNLAVGQYTLTVSNTGFKTDTIQNIRLVAGETLTFDVNF